MPKFNDVDTYKLWQAKIDRADVGSPVEWEGDFYLVDQKADGSRFATHLPEFSPQKQAA